MTRIGKVLVVFVTVTSVAFAAFAAAMLKGGANWRAEAAALDDEFSFEKGAGEKVTWTVKARRDGQQVASGTLPSAVVKAREKLVNDANTRKQALDQQIAQVEEQRKQAAEVIQADLQALDKREQELIADLNRVEEQIRQTTAQIVTKTTEAQSVRQEDERRREEVLRMRNVLEVLRTDLFALQQQRQSLEDELTRLRENLARVERRNEQLKAGTSVAGEEPLTK